MEALPPPEADPAGGAIVASQAAIKYWEKAAAGGVSAEAAALALVVLNDFSPTRAERFIELMEELSGVKLKRDQQPAAPDPPPPANVTIEEVLPMVDELYKRNPVGCCLHIVLDDDNLKDGDVLFCIHQAEAAGHTSCAELGEKLLQLSQTQRGKVRRLHFENNRPR